MATWLAFSSVEAPIITVLYFAAAREAAGVDRETWPSTPPDIAALRKALADRYPTLAHVLPRCRIAVNRELAEERPEHLMKQQIPIPDGAEIAIIPPVSGGASLFAVTSEPLQLQKAIDAVTSPGRGGLVTFTGNVRGETAGRRVLRLEYEAYLPMAEAKLAEIGAALESEHGASVAIIHRIGVLSPGESAVVIACAAPHRAAAFRACEIAIERLKQEAPIWKREVFEDGSVWVGVGP